MAHSFHETIGYDKSYRTIQSPNWSSESDNIITHSFTNLPSPLRGLPEHISPEPHKKSHQPTYKQCYASGQDIFPTSLGSGRVVSPRRPLRYTRNQAAMLNVGETSSGRNDTNIDVQRNNKNETQRNDLNMVTKALIDYDDSLLGTTSFESTQYMKDLLTTSTTKQAVTKTFVRPTSPQELLDYPVLNNPRVTANIFIMSPLHIGGGDVNGKINVHIRGIKNDDIRVGRIAVDIVGIEELSYSQKAIFFNVATELVDDNHPPPANMLKPLDTSDNIFWKVKPCRASVEFHMTLPLKVGPGAFHSTRARIRYVIHATVLLSINGSKVVVRCCRDLRLVSALDPERTFTVLDKPLVTSQEQALRWGGHKTLKLIAALQRTVWVSGTAAFLDVNIVNNTSRRVRKLKVKLLRHIIAYKTTVAAADEFTTNYMRTPSWIDHKIIAHSELNIGSRWRGVKANDVNTITCEIEIPRSQLTIDMGKLFEVKYFLNIGVCVRYARTVKVQLPITIIHMNSVDIIPNNLEQVSHSIRSAASEQTVRLLSNSMHFVKEMRQLTHSSVAALGTGKRMAKSKAAGIKERKKRRVSSQRTISMEYDNPRYDMSVNRLVFPGINFMRRS